MVERLAAKLPKLLPELTIPTVAEVHFAGVGESAVQDQLGELLQGSPRLTVGITAHEVGHVTIRVVRAPSTVKRRVAQVRRQLKPWLLPEAGVPASVVSVLENEFPCRSPPLESCQWVRCLPSCGAIPGASAVLREGAVAYHNGENRPFWR